MPPLIPPVPATRFLKVDTLPAREQGGHMHRVTAADGYAWGAANYASLSVIVRHPVLTRAPRGVNQQPLLLRSCTQPPPDYSAGVARSVEPFLQSRTPFKAVRTRTARL